MILLLIKKLFGKLLLPLIITTLLSSIMIININNNVVNGKLCPSIEVRNNVQQLSQLNNCTTIDGNLKILLIEELFNSTDYSDYSFPKLRKINGYLMVYNVYFLRSLQWIFPNLQAINGQTLFSSMHQYSLILSDLPHLEEIGLHNLLYIARGGVKVDKCPHLCYVDTIDWKRIGATTLDFTNRNYGVCEPCPRACNGYCWNSNFCQKLDTDKCHEQCLGCTAYNSSYHCNSCKNFEDSGNCVATCPKNKYVNKYSSRCVTAHECVIMLKGTWWIFQNECVKSCPPLYEQVDTKRGQCRHCGDKCVKTCPGAVIDNLAVLQELNGCTHITGSLEIRVTNPYMDRELEQNVGKIVVIEGYLKIARSTVISSLDFLKNLRIINGDVLENQRYALFVYENQNLQRLWDFTKFKSLEIRNGSFAFHNNPQLCLKEIELLANITGIHDKADINLFRLSNGDKAACNFDQLIMNVSAIHSTNVTVSWERSQSNGNDTIIGYTIYYKDTIIKNVTTFESKDVCDDKGWKSVFVTNNSYTIMNLTPFTRYAYYVKTYRSSMVGSQSAVAYFITSSQDPTEPRDVEAIATSNSSIKLKWDPPENFNGVLAYYSITVLLEPDYLPLISQRNYCQHPHIPTINDEGLFLKEDKDKEESEKDEKQQQNNDLNMNNCSCSTTMQEEVRLFSQDIATLCNSDSNSSMSTMTMAADYNNNNKINNCNKIWYNTNNNNNNDLLTTTKKIHDDNGFIMISKRTSEKKSYNNNNQTYREIQTPDANLTKFEVKNLRHFSLYIFLVTACSSNNNTAALKHHCSPVVMVSQRTKKHDHADDIHTIKVTIDDLVNASIDWPEPISPNSIIVAYQIEHKRIDLEHPKPQIECITSQQYNNTGKIYKISKLLPGKYSVRVQAISLAGPGAFSQPLEFEIKRPNDPIYWLYPVLFVSFVLVSIISFTVYYWYRKKHAFDNIHLIARINPDYDEGTIYMEDEWEMDRNNIEILRELGKGSFGQVYEGRIKSSNYRCAVKSIPETADRIEFLNEGSVMKSFCNCHHVIKLLGIVSRGQPPLVVMELMERGDLKSYLRRCRQPSQNLTSNELYRMAIEIADGMAYLTAKKFVHRDLAARNCMVDHDRTVKIGDFGMARDIYETDYYKKDTVGLLPVRWMAPESLADGVFTSDSDVWSYGIVLWEMATLAEQPYQGLSNEEVLHFVKNRGHLERPNECSDLMYEVMDACWAWRPIDRPEFTDIVERLVSHVGEDFRLVAFCYSSEGQEHAMNAGKRVYNPPAMSGATTAATTDDELYLNYNNTSGDEEEEEEEIGLCTGESNRPINHYLPFTTNQRYNMPSSFRLGRSSSPELYPHSSS